MKIELNNLDKVSLNAWYSGLHWSKRKALKDKYKLLILSQTEHKQTEPCEVIYNFEFKNKPLDASNCSAMIKLIEDVIFPDDSPNIVKSLKIVSQKSNRNHVTIDIINML